MNISLRMLMTLGAALTGWLMMGTTIWADATAGGPERSTAPAVAPATPAAPSSAAVSEPGAVKPAGAMPGPATQPAAAGASTSDTPAASKDKEGKSARDAMQELLNQRKESPVIEPSRKAPVDPVSSIAMPTDPRVLGVAPGQPASALRREGEYVVNRRGRLVRASNQGGAMFVFQGDGEKSPEPPMVLIPCQLLQSMEELVQERGDKLAFILSGQVLTYRGANYLMPTMMNIAVDKGNLQH